jgi:hypothetical protein
MAYKFILLIVFIVPILSSDNTKQISRNFIYYKGTAIEVIDCMGTTNERFRVQNDSLVFINTPANILFLNKYNQ